MTSAHHTEGLAGRLFSLRKARGVSQNHVARAAHISAGELSQLERGISTNPRLSTLVALANFYECRSLEELFGPLPSARLLDPDGPHAATTHHLS